MESSYQRLAVPFKLRRGLEPDLAEQTDYFRTLSLLGAAFEGSREQGTHSRLMAYLERKGSMEYWEPVWVTLEARNRAKSTSTLVGANKACQTCRRCVGCDSVVSTGQCSHNKLRCDCPFPRRIQGWGKVQCAEDLEAIDNIQRKLALAVATGKLGYADYTRKNRRCEGMARACRNKLFAIRKRMEESEQGSTPTDKRRGSVGKDVAVGKPPSHTHSAADVAFLKSVGISV